VSVPPDLLSSVTDGLGQATTIAYKPLTDSTAYAKDTGASAASYPNVDVQAAMYVVAQASQTGGGTSRTAVHKFGGLKNRFDGRGLLGFRWTESTDPSTGLRSRTENRQDWPYAGMPSLAQRTQSSGAVLSQVTNTLSCTDPASGSACTISAGNRYFPFVSQSVETGNDLNGAVLPTVTTTTQFDTYGNPTAITVTTGDGHGKTTTNTFVNDIVNWLLGRLARSTVQSTSP
jgi:hypothetical protein